MATLAGNFVNASPIGDMTVWFLALDAAIDLTGPRAPSPANAAKRRPNTAPEDLYLGYKQLAKQPDEIVTTIRFKSPAATSDSTSKRSAKRTYLDISTVNTAISLESVPPAVAGGLTRISDAHIAAGGVAPIPLYLKATSAFLRGKRSARRRSTWKRKLCNPRFCQYPMCGERSNTNAFCCDNFSALISTSLFGQ